MPLITGSSYHPPFFLHNPHLQTILPQIIRRIGDVRYTRERIMTPDDDFMDIDWSKAGAPQCAVLLHGLEGHSYRSYMLGMARACNRAGWDVAAVNLRGCSGEPNRLPGSYHQGSSDDLATVVDHVASLPYRHIALIGFSLGGNVVLKYLGDSQWGKPSSLAAAVAISAPCELTSCAHKLNRPDNRLYLRRFITMLRDKLIAKKTLFPDIINLDGFEAVRTFKEFDDRYTAPLHGFKNAEDYWQRCSSLPLLSAIDIPTLMISATDDPVLTPACFPRDIAHKHRFLTLEAPRFGGHVGFMGKSKNNVYWHEQRALAFLQEACG